VRRFTLSIEGLDAALRCNTEGNVLLYEATINTQPINSQPCNPVAGYVMAGGGSTRFGQDKARAILAGKPMLTRMVRILLSASQLPSTSSPRETGTNSLPHQSSQIAGPAEGPLGGIITALLHSNEGFVGARACRGPLLFPSRPAEPAASAADWNLILSCDMPFLTPEFLTYLRDFAPASNAKAIVLQSAQGREPLCACWHTSAAAQLQSAFESGMRRVNDALKLLNAEVLDESHWNDLIAQGDYSGT